VKYTFERLMKICKSSGPVWMVASHIYGGPAIWKAVLDYGEGSTEHLHNYTAWVAANDAGTGALTVIDEYTIKFKLEHAYTPWLAIIARPVCSIVSPAFVEAHGGVSLGSHNEHMDTHTCGTGPYKVIEWTVNDRVVLE
jgi:ABC-type transport system substrate-binding protein